MRNSRHSEGLLFSFLLSSLLLPSPFEDSYLEVCGCEVASILPKDCHNLVGVRIEERLDLTQSRGQETAIKECA